MPAALRIAVLGPVEVTLAGSPTTVAGTRLRRLLLRLAVDPGAVVGAGELTDAVWPEDRPADAGNALQTLVSRLRRAFGDTGAVLQLSGGYRLDLDPEDVDAVRFGRLAVAGHAALVSGDPSGAAEALREADRLWRGEPYLDAAGSDFAERAVARLVDVRLDALADLFQAELELDRAAEIVGRLEAVAADELLRERFTALLMSALAALGRTAEALAAYERLRRHLADELGVDPGPEVQARHLALLRGEPTPDQRRGPATNLRSEFTSFLGREAELERVSSLIAEHRLTTIVGPGGAGKTRLAGQAALPLADRLRSGVWMVELAPVGEAEGVPVAVLDALGARAARLMEPVNRDIPQRDSRQRLLTQLHDADCLLVMDNCEHLLEPAAQLIAEILARCPGVRVLATSREPLGIVGEALCVVPPLALPAEGADVASALGSPAVQLLVERASAVSADFAVDDATVADIVRVVRRLDGMPLAIELAAARLRLLPISEIAVRLGDRFRLLSGGNRAALPRHRTLRAVVEWSWDLLGDDERLLAERLAVFPAGATPPAAAEVCGRDGLDPADVPDLLLALADKSLLQPSGPGVRYRMLETIREYGVEQLVLRGEVTEVRDAHARYFRELVAEQDPLLRTADQLPALATFAAERENILVALRHLGDSGAVSEMLDMVLGLFWYWTLIGSHSEAAVWADFVLDATTGSHDPRRVLLEAGRVVTMVAGGADPDPDVNGPARGWQIWQPKLVEVVDKLVEVGSDWDHPMAQLMTPVLAYFAGDEDRGKVLADKVLADGDLWVRSALLTMRAGFAENYGAIDDMLADAQAGYEGFVQIGDRWGMASALSTRGVAHLMEGDHERAAADLHLALEYQQMIGATDDDLMLRMRIADLRWRAGDLDGALEEIRAARALRDGQPAYVERMWFLEATEASLVLASGRVDEAVALMTRLRAAIAGQGRDHPMYGHMAAILGATAATISAAAGDLDTASADLRLAYREGVPTHDQPVIAAVGVAIAGYFLALGDASRSARALGASARIRGSDNAGDPAVVDVRTRLLAVLASDVFDRLYADGKSLDLPAAIALLDPSA
ncbi:BTAD domain-containing putative transcriptional regulator [Nakamurella alba]|uniref:BTAD domain-containing putative transcriptional regulator n=1 Tax=Nakamurella alba TaxID=2665158 RepID=UPI0018A9A2DA|nr:BTAD domain-containing putative transcriptional regulator [Nakamurella alba]